MLSLHLFTFQHGKYHPLLRSSTEYYNYYNWKMSVCKLRKNPAGSVLMSPEFFHNYSIYFIYGASLSSPAAAPQFPGTSHPARSNLPGIPPHIGVPHEIPGIQYTYWE